MSQPVLKCDGLICLVRFVDDPTDAEFARYLAEMANFTRDTPNHVVVVVPRSVGRMSSTQRQMQAAFFNEHRDIIERNCNGLAFVTASPVQRFIMSSVFLLSRLPCAYVTVASEADAISWAVQRTRPRMTASS